MNELKPCPFCGGEAELNDWKGFKWIRCSNCKSEMHERDTTDEAIEAWNHREPVGKSDTLPCEWCDLSDKRQTSVGREVYMGFKEDAFDGDNIKFFIGFDVFKMAVIKFNHCPNCGRKIGGEQ